MAYATDSELAAYLDQIDQIEVEDDAVFDAILNRATSIVDGALGFSFAGYADGTVKRVRGNGSEYLILPPHETGSVTLVTTVPGTDMAGYWRELDNGNLIGEDTNGLMWSWGRSLYLVTADWGYGEAPDSIVEITLEVAVNIWRSKDKGLFTEIIGATGGGALKYIGGLTKQQKEIVAAVRQDYEQIIV